MNIAAHQAKEKNEKTSKRKAGEERKQADFKEAACYSSAVVQGASRRKNGLCEKSALVTGTLRKVKNHFNSTQAGLGTTPPR